MGIFYWCIIRLMGGRKRSQQKVYLMILENLPPLIISGELPDLNKELNLAKGHWSNYSKTKKGNNHFISAISKQYKHRHPEQTYPLPHRIHLKLDWFVKDKRKDPDNIYFAVKYVLDGMKEGGLLMEDGHKYISSILHTIQVDKQTPRVEVRWWDSAKFDFVAKQIF